MKFSRALRRYPYGAAAVIAVILVATILPLYWMIASSFKSSPELARIPTTLWPHSFSLQQYSKLFDQSSIASATLWSLALALMTTVIVIVLGSAAAYAVTLLRFSASKHLLSLSLVTQFLPQAATLVPIFILWSRLGLVNTLPGVTLVYVAFQLPVGVWLLTGYFASIPQELVDAAAVDGSGRFRTLISVVMPVAAPGLAAVAIWCAIGSWSELLFALVLLNGDTQTVPVVVSSIVSEHTTDTGMLLAGATVATLPPLIVFFLLQKYFTHGLTGAVKG
jgi:ABC-type glycerol-3-phosphate transport system permease component